MNRIYVANYVVNDFERAGYEPEFAGDYYESGTLSTYDLSLYDETKEEYDYSYMVVAEEGFYWHCPYDDTPYSSFFDENKYLYVNDDAWDPRWGFNTTPALQPISEYVAAYKYLLDNGMKREDIRKEDVQTAYQELVEAKKEKGSRRRSR